MVSIKLCENFEKNCSVEDTAWKVSKYGVFSGPYSVRIRGNTDQKKIHIWALFTQWELWTAASVYVAAVGVLSEVYSCANWHSWKNQLNVTGTVFCLWFICVEKRKKIIGLRKNYHYWINWFIPLFIYLKICQFLVTGSGVVTHSFIFNL